MIIGFLAIIPTLVAMVAVIFVLWSVIKKLPKKKNGFVNQVERQLGLNGKAAEWFWIRFSCFAWGFAISFLLCYHIFLITMPLVVLVQFLIACIVIHFIKKDADYRRVKRLWYFLGSLSALLLCLIRLFLLLGGSRDPGTILLFVALIIGSLFFCRFAGNKARLLTNTAASATCYGTVTRSYEVRHRRYLLFTTYYEYEYTVNGKLCKAIDSEASRKKKKRGTDISGTQKIVYVADNPELSWLSALDHSRMLPQPVIYLLVPLLIAVICVLSTDVVPVVQNIPAQLPEAVELFQDGVETVKDWWADLSLM
ncbi:MAG: hypothetical protein K6G80_11055 [Treponema sp.]|nr:hypothetical protein [Treponema sp.]